MGKNISNKSSELFRRAIKLQEEQQEVLKELSHVAPSAIFQYKGELYTVKSINGRLFLKVG